MAKELTIQFVPTYFVEGVEIAFLPNSWFRPPLNVLGFSHRVSVDRVLTLSWLRGDMKPSKEAAAFFYRKHVLREK